LSRDRFLMVVVIAVLVFSAFMLGVMRDPTRFSTIISPPIVREETPFESFDRCTRYGQDDSIAAPGEYVIEENSVMSRSGKDYVAADITGLLKWAAPGPVLLKTPFSLGGVTYRSPGAEVFTATYTAGFLFVTLTFADGAQRNLSVILAPPLYKGDGCVALASSRGQEAGVLVLLSPTTEQGPWMFQIGDRLLRESVYVIVQS